MHSGNLDDSVRHIACARWLELRCFEVLGGWVTTTPEPDVKVVLARQSHHHAWHADLFERVVPAADGLPDDGGGPPEAWRCLLDELEHLERTAERLAGAYGVLLPAKLAEYDTWWEATDGVRDAPLRRWLGFVLVDERADLAEGRALLDGLDGETAAPARDRLAASLREAGLLLQ